MPSPRRRWGKVQLQAEVRLVLVDGGASRPAFPSVKVSTPIGGHLVAAAAHQVERGGKWPPPRS